MTDFRETERAVFDIAVGSLDFGSGFLDDEQVEHLRAYAVHLGVDPWVATPEHHRPKYCPGHRWRPAYEPGGTLAKMYPGREECKVCGFTRNPA